MEKEEKTIDSNVVDQVIAKIRECETLLAPWIQTLTPTERKRLTSIRVKGLGFLEAVLDAMRRHPDLVPQWIDPNVLDSLIEDYSLIHGMLTVEGGLQKIVSDMDLIAANEAYTEALKFYNLLRDEAKAKNPDAMAEYANLKVYFNKSKTVSAEPTKAEIERDVASLLHGTKDGRIVIENTTPAAAKATLTVSDEVESKKDVVLTDKISVSNEK